MHAIAKTFAIAFASVAAAAAVGVGLADRTARVDAAMPSLAEVVVVSQRADQAVTARLPRVVVQARRAGPATLTTAAAKPPVRPA